MKRMDADERETLARILDAQAGAVEMILAESAARATSLDDLRRVFEAFATLARATAKDLRVAATQKRGVA